MLYLVIGCDEDSPVWGFIRCVIFMDIHVGSVWEKVGEWDGEEGQLIIIENVSEGYVNYRYSMWNHLDHNKGLWTINVFLRRFRLIKEM